MLITLYCAKIYITVEYNAVFLLFDIFFIQINIENVDANVHSDKNIPYANLRLIPIKFKKAAIYNNKSG